MIDTIKIRETCPECYGEGILYNDDDDGTCPKCHGKKMVPIIYTHEKWLAAGYELHDDLAVWYLNVSSLEPPYWDIGTYIYAVEYADKIIIATPAITREVLEVLK